MIRRTPRSTRTDTLFPYTTLFRSVAIASDIGARQFTGKIGTGERFGLLHIEKGDLVRLPVQDAPLPERLQRLVGVDQRNAERVGELRLRHGDFKRVLP